MTLKVLKYSAGLHMYEVKVGMEAAHAEYLSVG